MEKQEFNLKQEREKLFSNMDYLFSKINWGASFLDAKASYIMNTWKKVLLEQDTELWHRLRENLDDIDKLPTDHEVIDKLMGRNDETYIHS